MSEKYKPNEMKIWNKMLFEGKSWEQSQRECYDMYKWKKWRKKYHTEEDKRLIREFFRYDIPEFFCGYFVPTAMRKNRIRDSYIFEGDARSPGTAENIYAGIACLILGTPMLIAGLCTNDSQTTKAGLVIGAHGYASLLGNLSSWTYEKIRVNLLTKNQLKKSGS